MLGKPIKMKILKVLLFLMPITILAQDYVDIFKTSYAYTFNSKFENTTENTDVNTFETSLILPFEINKNITLITGLNFDYNQLMLFPNAEETNLYSTTIRIGFATTFSEKWSSTIVLLPKVASDYSSISSKDFYLGGFAIFKNTKRKNLFYRYGFYVSDEAFGLTFTPIIGCYYLSPDNKFEADISLPIATNINYNFGAISIGFDYFGIGRSYNLKPENDQNHYVEQNRLEFANYVQFNSLSKNILFRFKLGYTDNEHKVYEQGDKIDFKFIAFNIDDNRTLLNPKLSGSLFFRLEAIYRFKLE